MTRQLVAGLWRGERVSTSLISSSLYSGGGPSTGSRSGECGRASRFVRGIELERVWGGMGAMMVEVGRAFPTSLDVEEESSMRRGELDK